MRPVREITAEMENRRTVELVPGNPRFLTSKCDPVEPEPVGTIIVTAFRVTGYDPDCDGSLMARLEHIDKDGNATGWEQDAVPIYPNGDLVVTAEEWRSMFEPPSASNVAALVDAARDLLDYVEIDARRQREETGLEMAGLQSLADSLRAALARLP